MKIRQIWSDSVFWYSLLFFLPFIFFATFAFEKGLFLANDFSANRIWWTQMDTFFWAKGFFPLWNPTFEMGHPWLAMSTGAGSLYPLRWWTYFPTFFGGQANYWAQYIQISIHLGIAMSGIFTLLRRYAKVSSPTAAIAASCFLLNQQFNTFTRFPNGIENIVWAPWIIYFTIQILEEQKFSKLKFVPLIICWSLTWLAGYGQFSYFSGILVLIFVMICARSLLSIGIVFGAGILGTLLAVGAIYPAAEWVLSHPLRNGKKISNLSLLGVTDYKEILLNPFGVDVHVSAYCFPSFVLFFMVGVYLFLKKKKEINRISVAMLISFLLLCDVSRGTHGLSYEFLYKYFPFFGAFNGPAKLIWLAFIPFSWFLALGFEWLFRNNKSKKPVFLLVFIFTFFCAIFSIPHLPEEMQGIWQPLKVGWINIDEAQNAYLILLIGSSALSLIYFSTSKKWIIAVTMFLMTWLFASKFAVFNTWFDSQPNAAAVLGTREAFPDGLLAKRTYDPASIANIGLTDPIVDPPMWALMQNKSLNLFGDNDVKFPASRFIWRPSTRPGGNASIHLNTFSPNNINFDIESSENGEVIFLNKFSSHWQANRPFSKAQPFNDFFSFSVKPGKVNVEMKYVPNAHILGAAFSVVSFFLLIAFWLDALSRHFQARMWRVFAAVSVSMGIGLASFVVLGSYKKVSLSSSELFGINQMSYDHQGLLKPSQVDTPPLGK